MTGSEEGQSKEGAFRRHYIPVSPVNLSPTSTSCHIHARLLVNEVLALEERPQVEQLPGSEGKDACDNADREPLDARVRALVGIAHTHLTRLEVRELVDNLLDHSLELAHLDLEQGEGLLVGNGTGVRRHSSDPLVVDGVGANVNVEVHLARVLAAGFWRQL